MAKLAKHPLIAARVGIQALLGAATLAATMAFGVSLLWVLAIGLVFSVLAGKFFCRWACPIGLFMEAMFRGSDSAQSQYLYYKAGCPIAWAGGLLNRFSLFRIRKETASCIECGKCDQACYIPAFKEGASVYKAKAPRPQDSFTCSRCLKCVASCPTGSLKLRFAPLDAGK